MSARQPSAPRSPLDTAGFGIFGVNYVYGPAGAAWFNQYIKEWSPRHQQISNDVAWVLKRQHRRFVTYYDAMTWLQSTDSQMVAKVKSNDEYPLLQSVMGMLIRGDRYDDEILQELALHPSIENVATQYCWFDPKHPLRRDSAEARANLARFKQVAGEFTLRTPGIYREFKLDMGRLAGSAENVPWERLILISLLIQVRADLEVFYETGHRRLARCQYPDCQAWYIRKPMGQKQQFCSDVCRAMSNRRRMQRRAAAKT